MKTLHIDIETYSPQDLAKVGVYRYVDDTAFSVLLFAYSIDGCGVECIDLTSTPGLPTKLADALQDPQVIKYAHNAQFERVCLAKEFGIKLDPAQWRCTMIWAAELGLPQSLDKLASYLNLEQQKDKAGARLISRFCKPNTSQDELSLSHAPNKAADYPDDWDRFIEYCKQDVVVEMELEKVLSKHPLTDQEWELYALDQKINDNGFMIDRELVEAAVEISNKLTSNATCALKALTGLANPNSVSQLLAWCNENGAKLTSVDKKAVEASLEDSKTPLIVKKALQYRQATANTSVKKYQAMLNTVCSDNRIHGLVQFYGASRTGRWAGRLVQVQNLPRGDIEGEKLDQIRELVKEKDSSINSDALKSLIRTAFIPPRLYTFLISDFSAIEARVLAWLAGETWALKAFADHGKIYEATAAKMYRCEIDNVDKDMRQKGKVAVLACGYGGGVNALKAMGATKIGLKENQLQPIIDQWRDANPNIVRLWQLVDNAAKEACLGRTTRVGAIRFRHDGKTLFITLPNGRFLAYQKAKWDGNRISYDGQGTAAYFTKQETWGGKLVENITQAVARDLLAEGMLNLDLAGYKIVAHVHDEIIIEELVEKSGVAKSTTKIDEINGIISVTPKWAEGLPLNAEGFISRYYKK